MRYLVLFLLAAGCAQSGINNPHSPNGTTCVAGADGYDTNTPTDDKGRFPITIPHGKITTLKICDGAAKRVITVYGATPGSIDDNQDGFLTDGAGHILTPNRVLTLSQTPVKLGDLEVTGRCQVMWDGGCDAAAPVPPAAADAPVAPAAPEATTAPTPAPEARSHGKSVPAAAPTTPAAIPVPVPPRPS
ncbi:MAG: hypothetical protein AAB473_01870 [Patescibacteria group bacterium]